GPRVPRDVMGGRERPVCARTLGMHASLGNDLSIEVRELLQEPHILQQHGTPRPCCSDVLIVWDGRAESGAQLLLLSHGPSSPIDALASVQVQCHDACVGAVGAHAARLVTVRASSRHSTMCYGSRAGAERT